MNAVVDAEVIWIQLRVRREGYVDAVQAQARFIRQVWTKDVRFVQGEYLPPRLARVTPSGKRVSLKIWLTAFVTLEGVIAMKAIVGVEIVTHIASPLIEIDRRSVRPGKPSDFDSINNIDACGSRNQRQQLNNRRIRCQPLVVRLSAYCW